MPNLEPPPTLTPDQVMTWLGCKDRKLASLISDGKLNPMQYGATRRFLVSEVYDLIADRQKHRPARKRVAR